MSKTIIQYQLPKLGARFAKVAVPAPIPGPNDICFRTRAVGLNPLDWKSQRFGVNVETLPAVLGIDAAGVIESMGSSVDDFRPGDEVMGACGDGGNREAAFQEMVTLPRHLVGRKPTSLTFEQASTLPTCYMTAASAITNGLHISLPYLDSSGAGTLQNILVLGGSSTIGAAAIQLLRMALPSATILTTSSAVHHKHLVSLGATKCFERSAQSDPTEIKAATQDRSGVDGILDPVSAALSEPAIFEAFRSDGPKFYSRVVTSPDPAKVPDGVHLNTIFSRMILRTQGGMGAMSGLFDLVESGRFKLPVNIEIVGKGFDAIEPALEKLFGGVSGTKLAVSIE